MELVGLNGNITKFLAVIFSVVSSFVFFQILNYSKRLHPKFSKLANFKKEKKNKKIWKSILYFGFILSILVTVLRPVSGVEKSETQSVNLDIIFVIDTSLSMNVEDYGKSNKSRLDGVKDELKEIINSNSNARFSVISFHDKSFIQLPLTFDSQAAKIGVESLVTAKTYATNGTGIGSALSFVDEYLEDSDDPLIESRQQIVFLVSDGGTTLPGDYSIEKSISKFQENGVKIFTLGVGTKSGGKIPIYGFEGDFMYNVSFKGKDVIAKLDEKSLREIAQNGEGEYFYIDDKFDPENLNEFLADLQNFEDLSKEIDTGREYYYIFSLFSTLLLILIHFEVFDFVKALRVKKRVK